MTYNPTVGKELAMMFLELTGQQLDPVVLRRTIAVIRELFIDGYTDEEIAYGIKYSVKTGRNVFSIRYVQACLPNALKQKQKEERPKQIIQYEIPAINNMTKVEGLNETAERNREKVRRNSVQSGQRAESYFNLFEGQ